MHSTYEYTLLHLNIQILEIFSKKKNPKQKRKSAQGYYL